ncbi:MAG: DUF4974 domain-containing protein, partial [Flavihumibacter sp.]|nr:DUF4974 domain-containing protein [Flavihumibacter sp.]
EGIQVNKQVDIDDVMAWKNGYFSFNQADLSTIMRQISRWYDVEVIYRGALPKRRFGGELARATSLEQVLAILQASNINFKIENKTIIVQP